MDLNRQYSREIADTVSGFGGEVMLTDPDHPSATLRLWAYRNGVFPMADHAESQDVYWVDIARRPIPGMAATPRAAERMQTWPSRNR